jgi:hypothetical protein
LLAIAERGVKDAYDVHGCSPNLSNAKAGAVSQIYLYSAFDNSVLYYGLMDLAVSGGIRPDLEIYRWI